MLNLSLKHPDDEKKSFLAANELHGSNALGDLSTMFFRKETFALFNEKILSLNIAI